MAIYGYGYGYWMGSMGASGVGGCMIMVLDEGLVDLDFDARED